MLRKIAPFFVLFFIAAAASAGEFTPEQRGRVLAALSSMAAGGPADALLPLVGQAPRTDLDAAAWRAVFQEHLQSVPFTARHGAAWWRLTVEPRPEQESLAAAAGRFMAVALDTAPGRAPAGLAEFDLALQWLEQTVTLPQPLAAAVAAGVGGLLAAAPLDPARLMPAPAAVPAETASPEVPALAGDLSPLAVQAAVTLGALAGPVNVGRWMRLPDSPLRVFQTTGVWLFDGGLLPDSEFTSLASLMSAAPPALTGLSVLLAPGVSAAPRAPGAVAALPVAPSDSSQPAFTLPPGASFDPVPLFTLSALRQTAVLIQAKELPRRPELLLGRDRLLGALRPGPANPLNPFLAAGGYQGPDDFLPALAVLWMHNSEALLGAASALRDQGIFEPLIAVLLTADLFSNGGATTILFRTDSAGVVSGRESALRRVALPDGRPWITGLAAGGSLMLFDLGPVWHMI